VGKTAAQRGGRREHRRGGENEKVLAPQSVSHGLLVSDADGHGDEATAGGEAFCGEPSLRCFPFCACVLAGAKFSICDADDLLGNQLLCRPEEAERGPIHPRSRGGAMFSSLDVTRGAIATFGTPFLLLRTRPASQKK